MDCPPRRDYVKEACRYDVFPRHQLFPWRRQPITLDRQGDADLHAAIRVAGFEGKPLLQANVLEVAALFLKSPSGKGCNEKGTAGVPCLPSF